MRPRMPRPRFALCCLLAFVALQPVAARGPDAPPPATAATALRLPDVEGRERDLQEWAGRPLLLNYWATWCGPCLKEMPELQHFAAAQAAKSGVQVVGIALDEPAGIRAYLDRVAVRYPILVEQVEPGEPGTSARFGNVHGVLPYSVLLDADGQVLRTKLGPLTAGELETWTASIPP